MKDGSQRDGNGEKKKIKYDKRGLAASELCIITDIIEYDEMNVRLIQYVGRCNIRLICC